MSITSLNFRNIQNKCEAHNISDEVLNITDNKAYLLEALEYSDGSYSSITIVDGNNNQLVNGSDYTLTEDAALITFNIQPITPCKASYRGVGSIIWAQDVKDLQTAVSSINTKALNKTGDTLEGVLNVNGFNIENVSTINNINLWSHNHSSGNGSLIPTSGLENNAVTTSKIQDLNITTDKIADAAIVENKIINDAITTNKIKDSAVTNNKILDGTITATKLNLKSLIDVLYPIGSIYIGLQDNCPLATFGTTWQKITDGYYLQQKLPNKNLGDLVSAGLPNIYGEYYNVRQSVYDAAHMTAPTGQLTYTNKTNYPNVNERHSYEGYEGIVIDASRGSNIYGKNDTVQTNAIEVNIWKRIS